MKYIIFLFIITLTIYACKKEEVKPNIKHSGDTCIIQSINELENCDCKNIILENDPAGIDEDTF